jgi:hypothetical protein
MPAWQASTGVACSLAPGSGRVQLYDESIGDTAFLGVRFYIL